MKVARTDRRRLTVTLGQTGRSAEKELFFLWIQKQDRSAEIYGRLLFNGKYYKVENLSKGRASGNHFQSLLLTLREGLDLFALRDVLDHRDGP